MKMQKCGILFLTHTHFHHYISPAWPAFYNNLGLNLKNYQNDVDTRLSLFSFTDFQGYIGINF